MFEILQYPFIQRAFIAGILLAIMLGLLGVFVVLNKMSFFSEGIAHSSLAGIAIGLLLGVNPVVTAILFAIVMTLVMDYFSRKSTLSSDSIIGLIFISGMALGVLLLNVRSGFQPDLISYLFGNILTITQFELISIVVLSILTITFILHSYKKLALLTLNHDVAYVAGIPTQALHTLFNIFLAISVVLGTKVVGIILVTALIVLPVSVGKLVSRSFHTLLIMSAIVAIITVIVGIIISYYLDYPTGPVIILTGLAEFVLVYIFSKYIRI